MASGKSDTLKPEAPPVATALEAFFWPLKNKINKHTRRQKITTKKSTYSQTEKPKENKYEIVLIVSLHSKPAARCGALIRLLHIMFCLLAL